VKASRTSSQDLKKEEKILSRRNKDLQAGSFATSRRQGAKLPSNKDLASVVESLAAADNEESLNSNKSGASKNATDSKQVQSKVESAKVTAENLPPTGQTTWKGVHLETAKEDRLGNSPVTVIDNSEALSANDTFF